MVNNISLSQGMVIMDEAFSRTRKVMDGYTVGFSPEEYQRFYQCVYLLCVQRTCSENAQILHERYKNGLEECINSLVLPFLEDKHDEFLLTEFVARWRNYKVMVRWLSRFFEYLDRFYIPRVGALSLVDQAIRCFHDLVNPVYSKIIAAAISLINLERNGEKIDTVSLRALIEYFELTTKVGVTCYDDFQTAMLADAAAYYSQIASNGILYDSCDDYMYKVQWYLNQESERASLSLDFSTKRELLQVVKYQLLDRVYTKLAEKQQAENIGKSTDYQDLLSKCAGLNLGVGDHHCSSGSGMDIA